jgi:hypothetical protein
MLQFSSKQSTILDGLANLHEGQHWTAAANGKPDPCWMGRWYSLEDCQQIIRFIGHVSDVPPKWHDPVWSYFDSNQHSERDRDALVEKGMHRGSRHDGLHPYSTQHVSVCR